MVNDSFLKGLALLGLCMLLFLLARIVKDLLTRYNLDEQITGQDNLAVALSVMGYLGATTIVIIGALLGPSAPLLQDLAQVGGYGVLGILLLNVSRLVNDKLLLYRFCNEQELVRDRNVGTGAVEFGSYMASGLVVAGAIHGEGGSIWTALVTYIAGQLALLAWGWLYNRMTPFDVHDEIERDNVAVGVSLGGTLTAVGVVLLGGTAGSFVSWEYNGAHFVLHVFAGFLLLPMVRFVFDRLLIPRHALDKEIAEDRNVGAGLLESVTLISFAVLMYFVLDTGPLLDAIRGALHAGGAQ